MGIFNESAVSTFSHTQTGNADATTAKKKPILKNSNTANPHACIDEETPKKLEAYGGNSTRLACGDEVDSYKD